MINLYLSSRLNVTKRNILKLSAMFFDPLGIISPLVLQTKLIFKAYMLAKIFLGR